MRSIAKPTITAKEVFQECISTVNDQPLKEAYTACEDLIEDAETEFNTRFPLHQIYRIPQSDVVLGNIGKSEMVKVYDYRMVHADKPGRKYYDLLKASAPRGKCPFCAVRGVDTLDHYLPKTKFPVYAVVPVNLVPACTPCNKGKRVDFPTSESDQTFHPYYDNVESESWIKALVLQTDPVSFDFYVSCPDDWDAVKKARAMNHFDSFNLNELYASHANEEFMGAAFQLQNLFNQDPNLLTAQLNDSYESRLRLGINSWQAVMYLALLQDAWFTNGGVLNIGE